MTVPFDRSTSVRKGGCNAEKVKWNKDDPLSLLAKLRGSVNSPSAANAWRSSPSICHAPATAVFRSRSASNRPPAPRLLWRRMCGGGGPGQRVLSWQAQSYQNGIRCRRRSQPSCASVTLTPSRQIQSLKIRAANLYSVLVDGAGPGACVTAQAAARGADHPCRTRSSNAGHHGNSRQRGHRARGSFAHRRGPRMRFGRRPRGLPSRRSAGKRASLTRLRPAREERT